MEKLLRLHRVLDQSVVQGPGRRFVVWVQGCPLACPGCFSPDTHSDSAGREISAKELAEEILRVEDIEGVTFSGGEPMAQAGALAEVSSIIRAEAGLSTVCYSGFTLEHLRASGDAAVKRLLATIDILIDGPFIQSQTGNFRWRGSANQRIHFLSERYCDYEVGEGAQMEFIIGANGMLTTGIWEPELLEALKTALLGDD